MAYVFAPFYRLGAGPEFLYIVQNVSIALGALPVYLIAKQRFSKPLIGLVFAVAYLLYAPAQWVAWVNFHPEALVITPFLFAWYFYLRRWIRLVLGRRRSGPDHARGRRPRRDDDGRRAVADRPPQRRPGAPTYGRPA